MCTCFAPSNFAPVFSRPPIHSSLSAALRRLFFPPASRYADVDRPISFCAAGPPERSKIVIFDLPDQPFNIHSKEAGSPVRPSLLRPQPPPVAVSLCAHPFILPLEPHYFVKPQASSRRNDVGLLPCASRHQAALLASYYGPNDCLIKPSATSKAKHRGEDELN
jgi:hypothetical protein